MKMCGKCFTNKPLQDFYRLVRSGEGYTSKCKSCVSRSQKDRYRMPGVKQEIIRKGIIWKKHNTQSILKSHLKTTYGITKEYYDNLIIESNGQCAICNKNFRSSKDCCIDHDHSLQKGDTGFIRGLLCLLCNTKLGAREDTEWNSRATDYLTTTKRLSPPFTVFNKRIRRRQ